MRIKVEMDGAYSEQGQPLAYPVLKKIAETNGFKTVMEFQIRYSGMELELDHNYRILEHR